MGKRKVFIIAWGTLGVLALVAGVIFGVPFIKTYCSYRKMNRE